MFIRLFPHQGLNSEKAKKFNSNTFGNFIFENKRNENLIPKIFFSRKAYNPIFACDLQMKYLKKHVTKMEKGFLEKIERSKKFQKKSIFTEPRPPSTSKYCSVCHIKYQDYIKHINSKNHKSKFKNTDSFISLKIIQSKIQKQFTKKKIEKYIFKEKSKKISSSPLKENPKIKLEIKKIFPKSLRIIKKIETKNSQKNNLDENILKINKNDYSDKSIPLKEISLFLHDRIKFNTKGFSSQEFLTEKKSLKEIKISKNKKIRYSENFSKFKLIKKKFSKVKKEIEKDEKFLLNINQKIHKLKIIAYKNKHKKIKNFFNYLPELIE